MPARFKRRKQKTEKSGRLLFLIISKEEMLYFLHIFGYARQYEQALLRSLARKFLFFAYPVWAGGNRPQPE